MQVVSQNMQASILVVFEERILRKLAVHLAESLDKSHTEPFQIIDTSLEVEIWLLDNEVVRQSDLFMFIAQIRQSNTCRIFDPEFTVVCRTITFMRETPTLLNLKSTRLASGHHPVLNTSDVGFVFD